MYEINFTASPILGTRLKYNGKNGFLTCGSSSDHLIESAVAYLGSPPLSEDLPTSPLNILANLLSS